MAKSKQESYKTLSPVAGAFDFPCFFTPMLVKELRQGFRSLTFTALFIGFQLLLSFVLLAYTALSSSSNDVGTLASKIIIGIYAFALLVAQPLRGANALASEINDNTIDLMVLTRLSAWKIAFGKWVSLVSQSALLAITVLPYLILRYFLGGMKLFPELLLVVLILFISASLTACSVGLSALKSLIIRGLVSLGSAFAISAFIINIIEGYTFNSLLNVLSFPESEIKWLLLGFIFVLTYGGWTMLDFGASLIAPLSENRASLRRLIYLVIPIGALIANCFIDSPSGHMAMFIIALIFTAPLVFITYTETPYVAPRVYKPFVAKGSFGKFAGRFLYPGWSTGHNFLCFVFLFFVIGTYIIEQGRIDYYSSGMHHYGYIREVDYKHLLIFLLPINAILFPTAINTLFFRNSRNLLANFLIILISGFALTVVVSLTAETIEAKGLAALFVWNPSTSVYLLEQRVMTEELLYTISVILFIIYNATIFIAGSNARSYVRTVENQASEALANTKVAEKNDSADSDKDQSFNDIEESPADA